jgi:hypothetical protein
MIMLQKYRSVLQANMDKSLLEASGIPVTISGDDCAAAGYGMVLGDIILQVQDEDEDKARKLLSTHEGFSPLPDNFEPPLCQPEPPSEPNAERRTNIGIFVVLALLGIFMMLAVFHSRGRLTSQERSQGESDYRLTLP